MTTHVRDPYQVLGVTPGTSQDEVKKAYHRLAKLYHPDRNPGDKKAESKLKEANAAYAIVGDKTQRARFDSGEIDANGQEKVFNYNQYRPHTNTKQRGAGAKRFFDESDFTAEDIINDLFGGGKRKKSGFGGFAGMGMGGESGDDALRPGKDVNYTLKLPFVEATLGGKRSIQLAGGKEVSLTVPPGTEDGTKLRLKGQGVSARGGGPLGDAFITISVEPHDLFKREGDNIACDVPVGLNEAVLGATIRVPTLTGLVDIKVPPGSNTGTVLRLRGKGVPKADGSAGDQYVRLRVELPDKPDDGLINFLRSWSAASGFNPRKKAGME
jgi:DnaJ-class molecular chaperone